jgi:predicted nucleic acid-binding protein
LLHHLEADGPADDEQRRRRVLFDQGVLLLSQLFTHIIPDLFWVEIASVFRKAIRLARFDEGSARNAFTYLENCDLPAYSSTVLFHRAFEIAMIHNQSIYDSMYVALAVQSQAPLVTADERLANSLAAHLPVKWLGAV